MVVWGAATFAVVPPLQMRVMRVASEAPGLSSSVNIGAFNLGNALGAAAGGAVISAGLGYSFVPVMGAIVAGLALLLVFMSARKLSSQKKRYWNGFCGFLEFIQQDPAPHLGLKEPSCFRQGNKEA